MTLSSTTNTTTTTTTSSSLAESSNDAALTTTTSTSTTPWSTVTRYGPADGMIKLNVGGKEFVTLRSTLQSSAVLHQCVCQAEQQQHGQQLLGGDKPTTIFIDRDPTHFPLILTFLRNKTEGVAYNSKWVDKLHRGIKLSKKPKYVRLEQAQRHVLQDLYVEASYYQLYELQQQLCEQSIVTMIFSATTGGNPFEYANSFVKQVRRLLGVGLVGTGSVAVSQADLDKAKEWLRIDSGGAGGGAGQVSQKNDKKKDTAPLEIAAAWGKKWIHVVLYFY